MDYPEEDDYELVSPLEWALYEFDTISYDYLLHPEADERIRKLLTRLSKE